MTSELCWLPHASALPRAVSWVAAGRCGDGGRRSRGTIDGSARHPDRSRMPRRPRSAWLARAVTMALHIVAALLGRDALRQLVGVARDALRPRAEPRLGHDPKLDATCPD